MHASTERPFNVLTPSHRAMVANFNQVCRDLQAQQIRLRCIDLEGNRLVIDHEHGRSLVVQRKVVGMTRMPTAGSTLYTAQYHGVTLEWREPISHTRPAENVDLTFH